MKRGAHCAPDRIQVYAEIPGPVSYTHLDVYKRQEEAYSIAILLAEILGERLSKFEVRIFATDIDQRALDFARAGTYSTT